MPKTIIKNVAQQIGQLAGEIGEDLKKQPGELAGKVWEQVAPAADAPKVNLEEMKAKDAAQSRQVASQISSQLEQEIEQLRRTREEQLRQRREASAAPIPPQEAPVAPTSKPSRRFGMWGKRVKSAQDQSQPETAGRRVGG